MKGYEQFSGSQMDDTWGAYLEEESRHAERGRRRGSTLALERSEVRAEDRATPRGRSRMDQVWEGKEK